jgi:predicted Zn-dependent protease
MPAWAVIDFDDGSMNTPPTDSDRFVARRHLVGELLDRRRTLQARPLIAEALREQPDDLNMLVHAARADWLDDDVEGARQGLAEVLARNPEHLGARLLMLSVQTDQGALPEAEALALDLLKAYPESPWLYSAYSRVMLRALHIDKAAALADEALRLAPDDAEALRMRSLCDLVQGRGGLDGLAIRQLLAEHPEEQVTLSVVIVALVNAGRHREALRCAREMLRAHPHDPYWLQTTRELTAATHWSMWPLRPLQRYGWTASFVIWIGTLLALRVLARYAPEVAGPASWMVLAYVAYSWVWPPLFRKWVLRD